MDNFFPNLHRPEPPQYGIWLVMLLILLASLFIFCQQAKAEEVDINIIAKIESNGNPLAYNFKSGAMGLCQITSICYWEYIQLVDKSLGEPYIKGHHPLYDPETNCRIADWYLNVRIPQMLKAKHQAISLENILWAYNAGIGKVVKGIMPRETRNYIRKYKQLAKGN